MSPWVFSSFCLRRRVKKPFKLVSCSPLYSLILDRFTVKFFSSSARGTFFLGLVLNIYMFTRKDIETSDVLDCADEGKRRDFVRAAPCIGRFSSEVAESTGHVLLGRPLFIGAVNSAQEGEFSPESPGVYGVTVKCRESGREEDYAVYQCENLREFYIEPAYPSLHKDSEDCVGYSTRSQQKVLGNSPEEPSLAGSLFLDPVSHEFSRIQGKAAPLHVGPLSALYKRTVWPAANVHSKRARQQYLTFFRQHEVNSLLPHSGREGTRWRILDNLKYK